MAVTSADPALVSFLEKWRRQWPGWDIVSLFVPEPERVPAMAWFALLAEWQQAALRGEEPAPGLAKLAWWQDELRGWARGARRHPLGSALQRRSAHWAELADALPAWRHRDALHGTATEFTTTVMPFATAAAVVECDLWPQTPVSGPAMASWLLAQAVVQGCSDAEPGTVLAQWPDRAMGSAARRQLATLQHAALGCGRRRRPGRLQGMRWLWQGWRVARNGALTAPRRAGAAAPIE